MKKFLSMALALVMTLSLCAVFTAPKASAGFADEDELSSKYAIQAADVIQTIEVMDGYSDGTFRPTAGLTRQAAAKIICNMILGPTTAKALPTNARPFPDVLPSANGEDNQFAGYISYCSQQGIISGYGDGTFRPNDPLSGYAYLKMLLGALGYSATQEGYVGDNWKVNVAKTALGIGLNKGIEEELDGTTQVTREAAAIYAFNTLQADMVEYDAKNSIEINGVTVSMGGGNATPQTWNASSTSADNINAARSDGNNQRPIVQFAERYFDKLVREPNGYRHWQQLDRNGVWVEYEEFGNGRDSYTTDDFGRPAIRWFWKGVEIGTYARDPDATFVGNVKVNAIYEALQESTGMSSGNDSAYLYINSKYPNNTALKVERANDKDLDHSSNLLQDKYTSGPNVGKYNGMHTDADTFTTSNIYHRVDRIGDGTLIEVFRNDANNHVDVCVMSVYGGKVDAVKAATAKKDAYVTIDWGDVSDRRPETISNTGSGNNEYETEDFEEDDVVAYTYSDTAQSIKSMYLMTAESGALQSRIATKSLRLDDVTYNYGKEYNFNDLIEDNLSAKSSYIVYLDDNDYVLWVEEDEFSVEDYVLIERITIETSAGGVTTKTASVLGDAATNSDYDSENSQVLQEAYNQSKDPVGNSSWDAQAQVRYSNGTRRTLTLDDSKNYRTSSISDRTYTQDPTVTTGLTSTTDVRQGGRVVATVTVTKKADGSVDSSASTALITGHNSDGEGDGNWIAEPFTAGRIVRVSSNSNGYRLHSISDERFEKVEQFSISKNKIYGRIWGGVNHGTDATIQDTVTINGVARTVNLVADSETHVVVDNAEQGSYKSYYGIKNAPDIERFGTTKNNVNVDTVAYIYHNEGSVKLIFVTQAYSVKNSSNDIVFLAANSRSNLVKSDDGDYYEVSAVEKNEIKTILLKPNAPILLTRTGGTSTPETANYDNKNNCSILNDVTYDTNDFMTKGTFTGGGPGQDSAGVLQGIRRVNAEEIRLNTAAAQSQLKDVAENVRVYFVDGSDIEQIGYDEIVNDTQDLVYYVEDDDGYVTYLFIVDYDPVEDALPVARTYAVNTTSAAYVPAGYRVDILKPTANVSQLTTGSEMTFQIMDTSVAPAVAVYSGTTVGTVRSAVLHYTDNATIPAEYTIEATETGGVWTLPAIPVGADVAAGSLYLQVTMNT